MANKLKDFKLSTEIYTSNEVDGLIQNLSSDEIHFNGNIVGLSGNITSTDYNPNIAGSIAINGVVRTPDSIAIGCKNRNMISGYAIADASLCCNSAKREYGNAFAFGYNAKAYNYCTFAFGSGEAAGEYAIAMGGGNAYGDYAHAEGRNCIARHDRSFAWSGNWSQYSSHGAGTFNIDPINSLSGFYIGEKSLAEHLTTAIEHKPLSGKSYDGNTELSTLLFDVISALGGTVNFS